jgi:hypothetical protein
MYLMLRAPWQSRAMLYQFLPLPISSSMKTTTVEITLTTWEFLRLVADLKGETQYDVLLERVLRAEAARLFTAETE